MEMEGVLLRRFMTIFLLTAGISKNQKNKLWEALYSLFITAIYVIEMNGNYVGYKLFDLNVEEIVEMIFRLIGHTYVFLLHWFIKYNKTSVLKITEALLSHNRSDSQSREVTKLTETSFRYIGRMTLSVYYASMLTYMLMSIFVGILTKLKAAEVYIYLFPYWYSCPTDHNDELFCWNVRGYKSYLLKNGSQFGLMFIEQLALFNSVSLFLLLILNFKAHRTVLEKHLGDLRQKSDSIMAQYWNSFNDQKASIRIKTKHDVVFHRTLIDFIQYHQKVRNVVADAKPVLTGLLSLVLCFIWLLMLFTLCFIMVEESGSFIHRMKVGSLVIMTVLVFHLTCHLGELLDGLNYSFLQFLYSTPWYNLSGKSRKIIVIQLLLLQRSYRLKAFGMFFINMERFAFSMRTMYTVLNILLISLKKT